MSTYYYAIDASSVIQFRNDAPDVDFAPEFKAQWPQYTFTSASEPIVYGYDGAFYLQSQVPADPDATEKAYNAERAVVEAKYSAPWSGTTGGVLTLLQMTIVAAQASGQDTTALYTQYNAEVSNMQAEFETIDEKYGVA